MLLKYSLLPGGYFFILSTVCDCILTVHFSHLQFVHYNVVKKRFLCSARVFVYVIRIFRDMMLSLPQSREAIAARNKLEKQLYTVQELFEEFAVPFNLPDIKLALCYCSSTYDEAAVEDFYAEIIDGGKFFY